MTPGVPFLAVIGMVFKVVTAKMSVQPDPKVDAKPQAEIQKDMEEMTLETGKFPDISFRSSRIEKLAGGQWTALQKIRCGGPPSRK